MYDYCVLISLNTADKGINGSVSRPENLFHLAPNDFCVSDRSLGIIVEARAAAMRIAF